MPFDVPEVAKNAAGGTERMRMGLEKRLDPELTKEFQIIPSRVGELMDDKIRVYWLHDLPEDPATNHLKDAESRARFHKIVFCGNWQAERYRMTLGVPHDDQSIILETAIEPIEQVQKATDTVRLIYTSTPQRGLEILVPVFEKLCETHKNIELDVFSSFKIYGWEEADEKFKPLYDRIRAHPKMRYHSFAPHEEVVKALQQAHIHAYPSIWLECNSASVIEAMSAKCLCVHPNNGGLVDTSGGLNYIYNWIPDANAHAGKFYGVLDQAIQIVNREETQNYLQLVKTYADTRFNWTKVSQQWNEQLRALLAQYPTTDGRKYKKPAQFFHYVVK